MVSIDPTFKCYSAHLTMLYLQIIKFFLSTGHPWIRNYNDIKVPLDILIFRQMKAYLRSSSLRKAALKVGFRMLFFHGLVIKEDLFGLCS